MNEVGTIKSVEARHAAAEGSAARAAVLKRYREKKRRRGDGATVRYHMRQVSTCPLRLFLSPRLPPLSTTSLTSSLCMHNLSPVLAV
jgi:hypothetical protein